MFGAYRTCAAAGVALLIVACGPAFLPGPTTNRVTVADVVGSWKYSFYDGSSSAIHVVIDYFPSGDFVQRATPAGAATVVQRGHWSLSGASIEMRDVLVPDISSPGAFNKIDADWYLTDNIMASNPKVVIFGGEDNDPDAFKEFERLSPYPTGPPPAPIAPVSTPTPTPV